MNELPWPMYYAQRMRELQDEKLRIEGRIAELELLANKLKVVTKDASDQSV